MLTKTDRPNNNIRFHTWYCAQKNDVLPLPNYWYIAQNVLLQTLQEDIDFLISYHGEGIDVVASSRAGSVVGTEDQSNVGTV